MSIDPSMVADLPGDAEHLFHFGSRKADADADGIFVFGFDPTKRRLPIEDYKVLLTSYLALVFIVGISLRGLILTFLTSVESKSRPINVLQWMDQTNGVIGTALIAIFLIVATNSSGTMSDLFGDDFCKWIHFSSGKW